MSALQMAREAELLLVQCEDQTLALLNTRGELQGTRRLADLSAACLADDGSVTIAGTESGQVSWLGPDFSRIHEDSIGSSITALACDAFGRYAAVADRLGKLHVRSRPGTEVSRFDAPRPIRHLAFVAERPWLMAAADFGWAGCLDLIRRQWIWTDRPVSNVGSLAVAGSGDPVILACFSEGLRHCRPSTAAHTTCAMPTPCGMVAMVYNGHRGVAAGSAPALYEFSANGARIETWSLDQPVTALDITPLGDRLFVGHDDGTVMAARLANE